MTSKTTKKWSEIIKVIPHDPIPADFDNDYKLTLNPVHRTAALSFTRGDSAPVARDQILVPE
jgi:hypothetical protein